MVRNGGAVVQVQRGKERTVLAALLLNAGRIVSVEDLIEVLWGTSPPKSARATVQNYVMRLRKALGDDIGCRIGTRSRGYLIEVDVGELDVAQFEAHLAAARTATHSSRWDAAAAEARSGLALWRGAALADVESELLTMRDCPHLGELRLQALEIQIEADLHLGRHAVVITELRQLAACNPLRERLHGLLMLALYRDGRQAEALAAYQNARQFLIEEVGAEPGNELRELHRRILIADPALAALQNATPAPASSGMVTPRELPGSVAHFIGRTDELMTLTALLDRQARPVPGMIVISVIGGTAGVGKTALALHWAHQVAERFPDGQLYVDLRGYDPERPLAAADALAGFLRALGVPGRDIPAEQAERAGRYRSFLAGRRMLVVLDNAGSEEQVRPLLPGTAECAVVVTSRDSLAGLVARDGAARLDLDPLPFEDALELLRALIGERVDADRDAAATLAAQCCRLPLALRINAERVAARPGASLTDLVGELADQRRRLEFLAAGGDPRTAVRAVFSWSYSHLDNDAARAFRLLGLHPGPDFDLYAAAALTATSTFRQAGCLLDVLARAYLIRQEGPCYYGMHDLLRAYARELATTEDSAGVRQAGLTTLFDYYLYTAASAMDIIYPADRHRRPRIPSPATPVPQLADATAALAWLDTERTNLVTVAIHAADHGWPSHVIRLAATIFRYLNTGGYFPQAFTIQNNARRAASDSGDLAGETASLINLGMLHQQQSRYQQASLHFQKALEMARQAGDRASEAQAVGSLGLIDEEQGRLREAARRYRAAAALHRELGDRIGEARNLANLGFIDEMQGRLQEATGHLEQALALYQGTGDPTTASTMIGLGEVELRQGHHEQAAALFTEALAQFRAGKHRTGEAFALHGLGTVELRRGHYDQATANFRETLALAREFGDPSLEAHALSGLGEAFLAIGCPEDARLQYAAALTLTVPLGHKYYQAAAHDGLGRAFRVLGDAKSASYHWQQALALYADMDAPEADQVRAQLAVCG
jgi:DNA-binding SARP family transcriptional activator/Tfp pilus assembly protein PilF